MVKKLETRHVFLDTEVLIDANFQYSSGLLQRLTQLAIEDKVIVYLTDVTVQEIEANIIKLVDRAKSTINLIRKDGKILFNSRNPSFDCLFIKFDKQAVLADLTGQFHQFLRIAGVTIIDTSQVDTHPIFLKYFDNLPPFGSGKKKHEFPDAFALAALEHWCAENQQLLYVVSNDNDIASACESITPLFHIRKLEELIETLILEDEQVPEFVPGFLKEAQDDINQQIIIQFPYQGFWLEDYEGDVQDAEVVNIDIIETHLINISEETATFDILYMVTFTAFITYEDSEFSYYDKETGRYHFTERGEKTIERETTISIEVEISFDRDEPASADISYIKIISGDVGVSIDDYSDYPYK